MSRNIPGGTPLPLEVTLAGGETDKFPLAHVYDDNTDTEVVGSPFSLTATVLGQYRNSAFTPGSNGLYRALYITYNNVGHTTESSKYGRFDEVFEVNNIISEVSSRESESSAATRASANIAEHDATQATLALVKSQTDKMTFTGANINANITTISDKTGYSLTSADKDIIVDRVWDELKSGHTVVGSFSELLATQATLLAVKAKTDSLSFTSGNVNANAQVVADKTNYTLTGTDKNDIVDRAWDELLSNHTAAGSAGKALSDASTSTNAAAVADAVWDALVSGHSIPNTFGDYVQAIRQYAADSLDELTHPTHGLDMILQEVDDKAADIITEINANEVKIDAIIPYVGSAKTDIIAEVDENEVLLGSLSSQLTSAKADIIAEIDVNEVKLDALDGKIGAIQNNTTSRFIVPERLIKPTAGSKTYQFHLRLYDDIGNPEAPDSIPTIRIRRLDSLVDIVSGAAMTQDGVKVGAYYYDHTITSGTALYPMLVEATVIEGGVTRYVPAVSEIVEFESDLDAIQAQIAAVDTTVTDIQTKVDNPTYGLSALKTGQTTIVNEIDANETKIDAVKTKTDNLPASPASSSQVAAVTTAVLTRPTLTDIQGRLDLLRDSIKGIDGRDLTQVYDVFDLTPVAKTNDPRFAHLDADISSRSTLTAADVWAYATRTLSTISLPNSEVKKIWDYLASQATVSGSLGKRIADFLDVAISTRATSAQVASALAGVAQEATVLAVQGTVVTEANQNEVKLNTLLADTATIKGKTNNLPSTPASETTVLSETAQIDAAISALQLVANGIKAKTDNLPSQPATQGAVLAIPTNPLLDDDARLDNLDVAVSTRSTLAASSLTPLATTAQLTAAKNDIISEVNANEVKIDTINTKATSIKAKTDNLPADPASNSNVDSAETAILDAIDDISPGGSLTAADVWTSPTRTLTAITQPDLSTVAKTSELAPLAKIQYVNRMSTVYNNISGNQELIVWAEKDGLRVTGSSTCTVTVKNSSGVLQWTASLGSPTADGIFKFTNAITATVDLNYYVVISIVVDASARVNQQPFFTVG